MTPRQRSRFIAGFTAILFIFLFFGFFQWTSRMVGKSYSGRFLPLSNQEKDISSNLRAHVYMLAEEIGERNIWQPQRLNAAAAYIEKIWQEQGFIVQRQEYQVRGVESANENHCRTKLYLLEHIMIRCWVLQVPMIMVQAWHRYLRSHGFLLNQNLSGRSVSLHSPMRSPLSF